VEPVNERGQARAQAVAVTIACACIAGTLALVCSPKLAHVRWWLPLLGGLGCAVFAAGEELRHGARSSRAVAAYRAACWLAAGVFVAWVAANGYDHTTWAAWFTGSTVFGMAALVLPDPPASATTSSGPTAPAAEAATSELPEILREVGIKHAEVVAATPWPGGAGYDVAGQIGGKSGVGWKDVKAVEGNIANALDLPTGCGVEVMPGPSRRAFVLRVSTRDVLAATREYVEHLGTGPLSINGPLPLGWRRDGLPVEVMLRRACMTVCAMTDGGKSNCLHTLTAALVRCPDVLVWHIDLAGAGLSLPWIGDFLAGEAPVPVIDWVATTVDEARLMTEMAIQIILTRRAAYADLMAAANSDIVSCSASVPQIVIIGDEMAEATGTNGDPVVTANMIRIIQMGRAVGVRVGMGILRNTGTVLPTDAQAQIGARVLFGVADESEVGYALGWKVRLDLGDAAHPGCGWVRTSPGAPISVFRTPHTGLPRTIAHIASACIDRRPQLDAPSAAVPLGAHYADRWTRTMCALRDGPGVVRTAPALAPSQTAGALDLTDLTAATERARRAVNRQVATEGLTPDDVAGQFEALTGGDLESEVLRDAATGDEPRDRLMDLLAQAGAEGLSGHRLHQLLAAEGVPISRDTVYQRLRKDAIDGGRGAYIHPRFRQG
jgi:hypothetical protein